MSTVAHRLHTRHRTFWRRLQRAERIADDGQFDIEGVKIAIMGMGGIGTGTYDKMRELYGTAVVGVDSDPVTVRNQLSAGRNVLLGDPSDADFLGSRPGDRHA